MAVEVTLPKQLHHHAGPVIVSLVLLFIISASYLLTQTNTSLGRALVTRVVDVKPTANGLGKITIHRPDKPTGLQSTSLTGSTADLSLSFQ